MFRMFDKDNSGLISTDQVNKYIQKFDNMHAQCDTQDKNDPQGNQFKRGGNN